METSEPVNKARENRIRRRAQRLGYALRKSRARYLHINDYGEYMLVDPFINSIVAGEKFDLSLDDIEQHLEEVEERLRGEAAEARGKDAA